MLTRRQFLYRASAAIAAGMVLDPERLLWVPGAKTIIEVQAPLEAVMRLGWIEVGGELALMGTTVDAAGRLVWRLPQVEMTDD